MTWTTERVERAKTLAFNGLSASQIAADLGGVTRNAVIGKMNRLGVRLAGTSSAITAAERRLAAQLHRSFDDPK